MTDNSSWLDPLWQVADLGGPVLVILLAISIFTLALVLLKAWQYAGAHVGRRRHLQNALNAWDNGDGAGAQAALGKSKHFLAPVVALGIEMGGRPGVADRLESEAEQRLAPLENGFRVLDTVAQLAPLLGLLGTVIGMIEAFQALQDAGSQVDPSALAGGIWVALLTTAAGLSVAMPTSIALSWFEARIDAERTFADYACAIFSAPVESGGNGA